MSSLSNSRTKRIPGLLLLTSCLVCIPGILAAERTSETAPSHRNQGYVGWDQALVPGPIGHGILSIVTEFPGVFTGTKFRLAFDTDTVELNLQEAAGETWRWNTGVRVQGAIAGLLVDYFERGIRNEERGFYASYLEGTAGLEFQESPHTVRGKLASRRWFFFREEDGSLSNYTLPDDQWALSQSGEYVYWKIKPDPSWNEWHRTIRRAAGFTFGLRLTLEERVGNRPWGDRSNDRNGGEGLQGIAEQWAEGGIPITSKMRLQFRQEARWSWNSDDLNRTRIGGMNRYVVRVGGLPWASFLSSRHAFAHAGPRMALGSQIELGFDADAGWLSDPARQGAIDQFGLIYGFQALADWRPNGHWQTDLRLGWSPEQEWIRGKPYFSLYVSVGRGWI